jgi:hypothetical protein
VRFAPHHGFRPDFCQAADPESKGIVEHLVGYAKTDLMIPGVDGSGEPFGDLVAANTAAAAWCGQVNTAMHAEICAVPAERLLIERELLTPLPSLRASIGRTLTRKVDRLSCVRFGSARYSVPVRFIGAQVRLHVDADRALSVLAGPGEGEVIAEHRLVGPGETSIHDEHYGGPRPTPKRAVRPKTAAEKAFCALGPTAEAFLVGAAAAGNTRLGPELAAGGPWTYGRSWPPVLGHRSPPPPGTRSCSSCRASRPGPCLPTPSTPQQPAAPPATAAPSGRSRRRAFR